MGERSREQKLMQALRQSFPDVTVRDNTRAPKEFRDLWLCEFKPEAEPSSALVAAYRLGDREARRYLKDHFPNWVKREIMNND